MLRPPVALLGRSEPLLESPEVASALLQYVTGMSRLSLLLVRQNLQDPGHIDQPSNLADLGAVPVGDYAGRVAKYSECWHKEVTSTPGHPCSSAPTPPESRLDTSRVQRCCPAVLGRVGKQAMGTLGHECRLPSPNADGGLLSMDKELPRFGCLGQLPHDALLQGKGQAHQGGTCVASFVAPQCTSRPAP